MTPKEFTIDCSKWRCGGDSLDSLGEGPTFLRNGLGYMCCLGQIIHQIDSEILLTNVTIPQDLISCDLPPFLVNEYGKDSDLAFEAMEINDSKITTVIEKKELLLDLFKKHGYSLKFIN